MPSPQVHDSSRKSCAPAATAAANASPGDLHAWLAGQGATALPTSRKELYDEILDKEIGYWRRSVAERLGTPMPRRALEALGAGLTLLAPTSRRVPELIDAGRAWAWQEEERDQLAAVLCDLLTQDSEDGTVAVRPDPVADHLLLTVFGDQHTTLTEWLRTANDEKRVNACLALTRSRHEDHDTATALAVTALRDTPALVVHALAVAASQGGVLADGLEHTARLSDDTDVLTSMEAATPYRYTPSVIDALNTLANQLSSLGRHKEALDAVSRALHMQQSLEAPCPPARTPTPNPPASTRRVAPYSSTRSRAPTPPWAMPTSP